LAILDADGTGRWKSSHARHAPSDQGLINRPVEIEHEVDAQIAVVCSTMKQVRLVPATSKCSTNWSMTLCNSGKSQPPPRTFSSCASVKFPWRRLCVGGFQRPDFGAGIGPVGFFQRRKPALDTIGINNRRIHPEDTGVPVWKNCPAATISSPLRGSGLPAGGSVLQPAGKQRAETAKKR